MAGDIAFSRRGFRCRGVGVGGRGVCDADLCRKIVMSSSETRLKVSVSSKRHCERAI